MKKELTVNDYMVVIALIKWANKNKKKIEVTKMGDEFSGFYYKIKIQ